MKPQRAPRQDSSDRPSQTPQRRFGLVRSITTARLARVTIDNATVSAHTTFPVTRGQRVPVRYDPEKRHWVIEDSGLIPITIVYVKSGDLSVGPLNIRIHSPRAFNIQNVTVAVNTAPDGADLIVDVNLNGVTIFTTQANRPTIADGATEDLVSAPDVIAVAFNDVIEVDVDQVGSSAAGADLVVQVRG